MPLTSLLFFAGLVAGVFLLGFGLVEIPRALWNASDPEGRLQYLHYRLGLLLQHVSWLSAGMLLVTVGMVSFRALLPGPLNFPEANRCWLPSCGDSGFLAAVLWACYFSLPAEVELAAFCLTAGRLLLLSGSRLGRLLHSTSPGGFSLEDVACLQACLDMQELWFHPMHRSHGCAACMLQPVTLLPRLLQGGPHSRHPGRCSLRAPVCCHCC